MAILAVLLLTPAPAHATELGPFGGHGGSPANWTCPQGTYLIGFSGGAGAWLDRIAPICGPWSAEQHRVTDTRTGPFFGTSTGGSAFLLLCRSSAVAELQLGVTRGENKFVQGLEFRCRDISTPAFGVDSWIEIPFRAPDGGPLFVHFDANEAFGCPLGELGVGITVRSGLFVDALGLICAPPQTVVAAQAPAPAVPGRVLSRVQPPAPPAAEGDLGGLWATVTSAGARFRLFLSQSPQGTVSGSFSPGDGHVDGRLSGTRLIGKWRQGAGGGYIQITPAPDGSFHAVFTNGKTAAALASPDGTWDGWRVPQDFPGGPTPGVNTKSGVTYRYPYLPSGGGEPVLLDWCREWATHCGQAAADMFCATVDGGRFSKAVDFKEFKRAVRFNPSMTIGGRQQCNDINCSAFEYVTCGGGGVVASDSGLPSSSGGGSSATIVIPEPNLHVLNVRSAPGGSVLGTLPEGTTVSVVGECGSTAAGLGPATGGAPLPATGWCEIDAPLRGFVSAKYLEFGAAGLAAATPGQQSHASSPDDGFAGIWDAATDDGTSYVITLHQKGNGVSGSYRGGDGSRGEIDGKLKDRGQVLDFSWRQTDGNAGVGRFRLTEGGQSFQGTYALSRSPNKVEGGWNGTRR